MTNTEFGRRLGIHFTTASRIRNGKRKPSVAVLQKISREFDISLDSLVAAHTSGGQSLASLLARYIPRSEAA